MHINTRHITGNNRSIITFTVDCEVVKWVGHDKYHLNLTITLT